MRKSTVVGHVNPQQQRVVRVVGPSPTLWGQSTYELECLRETPDGTKCGHRYGANGPDIDGAGAGSGRRCPACQGGAPGDPIGEPSQPPTLALRTGVSAWSLDDESGHHVKEFFVIPVGGSTVTLDIQMVSGAPLTDDELQAVEDEVRRRMPDREFAWKGHTISRSR